MKRGISRDPLQKREHSVVKGHIVAIGGGGLPMASARFLGMWVLMAVAMSANGIFRELYIKSLLGDRAAAVVSAVVGILLIGLITRWGFSPAAAQAPSVSSLTVLSALLVGLTVVFETALGRVVDQKSWTEILDHYALWRGELWPIVLAWLAMTPFVWVRWWPPR